MAQEMRYRLRAPDGRFVGYSSGPRTVSLWDASTAYVFRDAHEARQFAHHAESIIGSEITVEDYPQVEGELRVGDRVRFQIPESPQEGTERYEIVEVRGDRVLARCIGSGMRITPTSVLSADELVLADG